MKSFAALMKAFTAALQPAADGAPLTARDLYAAAADATVILEAASGVIVDVNPAAEALLGMPRSVAVGQTLAGLLVAEAAATLAAAAARAHAQGRAPPFRGLTRDRTREVELSVSSVRAEARGYLLVHLAPATRAGAAAAPPEAKALALIAGAAESFLVTNPELRITYCNPAFVRLAKVASEQQAEQQPLTRWLQLPPAALARLSAQMAAREAVTVLHAVLVDGAKGIHAVEVHAVAVPDGADSCFGFWIRPADHS